MSRSIPRTASERDTMTVTDLIEQRAAARGDETLLRYQGDTYSYSEIHSMATAIAASLNDEGVDPGDHVCAFLYNSPEYLATWFALAKLGAVMVPLNVNLKADGLSYIVNDAGAETIILEDETRENYETARDALEAVSTEYLLSESTTAEYRPFDRLLDGADASIPAIEVDQGDTMCIIYTSGTTGLPKGVVLPHYAYVNTGWEFVDFTGLSESDRAFTTLPLFHCNAQMTTVMGSILLGTDFVMDRWFSASNFWSRIRESDATHFNYIGTMISALWKQPERDDDADNPAMYGWGAPAPQEIFEAFESRFGVELIEGYGLTESGCCAISNRHDHNRSSEGTVGTPLGYVEAQIVDENDHPVPAGEQGEIVLRPTKPNTMMMGYYNKPEKTVEDWQNLWIHTGDIGYRDEEGQFYFVDRKVYTIRRRGENISSMEVENVIGDHPEVEECAVFGVPSELGEEEVKAIVTPMDDSDLEPLDLVKHCENRLAYFKVPRYIEVRAELPKTATERVEKYKLREEGVGDAWDRETSEYEVQR